MNRVFEHNGYLGSIIPGFEFREDQLRMAEAVLESLVQSGTTLIEAGTGIGKTLAYLVPAMDFATGNGKKICLTTETKALQKQIIDKDLPVVKRIFREHLGRDFTYSLCLGSSNYPCRRRFETALQRGSIRKGHERGVERLTELFESGAVFSRFDLRAGSDFWSEISRDPDGCASFRCIFSTRCPYQMAKKEWMKSDLLVMNHYLFFSNIAAGKTYLPECDAVIFDEAHSLEDIASAQLGFELGHGRFAEITELFHRKRKRNTLLSHIGKKALHERALELIKRMTAEAGKFFEGLRGLFPDKGSTVRVRSAMKSGEPFIALLKEFSLLMKECEEFYSEDDLRMEFDMARGRLFSFSENLASFVFMNDENYVYWAQRDEKDLLGDIVVRGQPLNVSEIMREQVLESYDASVFVSATLSTGGDFSYITQRLGIDRHRALSLSSTFDYKSSVVLYVASDMPEPNSPDFVRRSAEITAEIIRYLEGNCLVLFTAYRMLGEVRRVLAGLIDYPIFSQDEYSPGDAMDLYLSGTNSVLMGTHSFWQGIDLQGDLLRGLIMMRLPFSVPDSPMTEAKMEQQTARGQNPFMSLQVPDAAIRFKQGFGRLIRSRSDRGIVALLDSRIATKPYGRYFLKSIPECTTVQTLDAMMRNYERLLG